MNKADSVIFGGVTPNLMYENANEALDWLQRVCGFKERARYVDQLGVVQQAEVYVGSSEVWLFGHGEGYWDKNPRGPAQYLVVWVNDFAAAVNQSWGVRNFYITDPGGYHWGFHRRLNSGYQQVKSAEEGGLVEILSDPNSPAQ